MVDDTTTNLCQFGYGSQFRQVLYRTAFHTGMNLITGTGGSVLQSPLIMPMLQLSSVPAHQAGKMNTYLLSNSEHFFPPLNAACTISNLVLAVTAYLNRERIKVCAEKVPLLATATALGIATTIYALSVMVPMNKRMALLAEKLDLRNNDTKAEMELRRLQRKWAKLNYGT